MGGYAQKLVCRATIPRPRADAIDRIADLLASWVASLGAGVPQKCETLACIRGVHPTTAAMKDVIVLLLMKREQPRLQFFARCALPSDSEEGDDAQALPETLPCVVSLRIVESRLSTPFRAVDIRSSEELAEELAASGMSWSIRPLVWRLPERRQLLDHIVTGLGDASEPKTKRLAGWFAQKAAWTTSCSTTIRLHLAGLLLLLLRLSAVLVLRHASPVAQLALSWGSSLTRTGRSRQMTTSSLTFLPMSSTTSESSMSGVSRHCRRTRPGSGEMRRLLIRSPPIGVLGASLDAPRPCMPDVLCRPG